MEHYPTMDCFVLGASSWECLGREHNPPMGFLYMVEVFGEEI